MKTLGTTFVCFLGLLSASASASANVAEPRLLATDDVHDCAFTSDGTVVAATSGGLVVEGRTVVTALEGLPDTQVTAVAVSGNELAVETPRGAARIALASLAVTLVPGPVDAVAPPRSLEIHEGGLVRRRFEAKENVCIATSAGLFVARGGGRPERVASGALPTGDVSALAASKGRVFIGTFDRGLYAFDGLAPKAVLGLRNPNVNALAWDEEAHVLWVATARGLERCSDTAPITCAHVGGAEAMHALLLTKEGVIAGGEGRLSFVGRDGTTMGALSRKEGAPFRSVWALARDAEGVVYVGTTNGIFYGPPAQILAEPRSLRRVAMVDGALPDDWVTALAFVGPKLVAGTYNAGIVSFRRDGEALLVDASDRSLGYVNVDGLRVLPNGRLAVATMDGLRIGTFGAFSSSPALGRDVTAVALEGGGWVASRRGVSRLARAAMASCAECSKAP